LAIQPRKLKETKMTFKLRKRSRKLNRLEEFRTPSCCRRVGFDSKENAVDFYIPAPVLELLFRHAVAYPGMEVGGYLFGRSFESEQHAAVEVVGARPITSKNATSVHFRFEIEDTVKAEAFQKENFPGSEIVGWYHTHPGHGIFMSSVDVATHVEFFKLFHRVALVIDPQRREFAAFVQHQGQVYSLGSILVVDEGAGCVFPELSTMLAQPQMTGSVAAPIAKEPEGAPAPAVAKEPAPSELDATLDEESRGFFLEFWRRRKRRRWLIGLAILLTILLGIWAVYFFLIADII
jgi:proteasome lid subunit RPN8/RPN11